MAKDYIENMENDTKYPLDYTWKSVNNFVFNLDVTFEDMQALCLGLAAELERRPTKRAPDVKPRRAVKARTRKASRG